MANKKPSTPACRNLLLDDLNWTRNKNNFCTFAFAWPQKDSSHGCEGGCDPVSTDWLRCYVRSYRQPRRLLHLPPGGDQFLSFSVLFFSSRIWVIRGEHGFWTLSQLIHTNTCQQNLEGNNHRDFWTFLDLNDTIICYLVYNLGLVPCWSGSRNFKEREYWTVWELTESVVVFCCVWLDAYVGLLHTIQPVRLLSLRPFSVRFTGLIFRNEVLIIYVCVYYW